VPEPDTLFDGECVPVGDAEADGDKVPEALPDAETVLDVECVPLTDADAESDPETDGEDDTVMLPVTDTDALDE
jgi:hypothetical protein